MSEDIAVAGAGEVEIDMVGQVKDGRLIGVGSVLDAQLVLIGERVGHGDIQISRDTFPRHPG